MKKLRTGASILLICLILCGLLWGCGEQEQIAFDSLEDFDDAKLGVLTGSVYDD